MEHRWSTLDSIAATALAVGVLGLTAPWFATTTSLPGWRVPASDTLVVLGIVLFAISLAASLRRRARFAVPVEAFRAGSTYLHLAAEDGRDLGYPVAHVFGPRRGLSRGRDRGIPRTLKRAKEGRVTHAYPDHFGQFEGPRPEPVGTYTIRWSLSQHADPAILASMSRKTIAKAKFLITEAQNKDAEKAITPDIYIVNATNERIRLSMRVTRDGDGARRDEHHTIDPMNREHFTPCKTGEFVYPDEFRVAPENDAPASPPLIDGRYLLEARTCTAVMRTHPDGTIESWNDYKPFARGEIEVSSYRASSR